MTTGLAAVVTIFTQLPVSVACLVVLVIPVGTFIVLRQIGTQKGIRVELMDTKADMDGAMVELLGGIETIRALDSAQTEGARIEARSEQLRKKEMRHHRAMAFYDCLKFVNEAFFSVLVIGLSVLLASQGAITVGTVLTAYLCFTQLTGPLRELHRMRVDVAVAERGYAYYAENRVRYLCLDGMKGYALVEGTEPYDVEFVYSDGMIYALTCSCYCVGNCKHEVAAMLQLREMLEEIESNPASAAEYARTGYVAAVSREAFFTYAIDGKKTGTITL